jgi:hypothetical protein
MKKILLILALTGSLYAQPDPCPKCVLKATRNFRIPLDHGASIEVHQGETFTGRMCLDLVRIEINGIQYKRAGTTFRLSVICRTTDGTEEKEGGCSVYSTKGGVEL